MKKPDERVGKAFRGRDNVVRWITHKSNRGRYQLLWLNEVTNVWHSGGAATQEQWDRFFNGPEVPAPQPGERYTKMGALGTPDEWTVPLPS